MYPHVPFRRILLLAEGQSNFQGQAKDDTGYTKQYHVSKTGARDPLPGCNNTQQGGSLWPYLIDLGLRRGVEYVPLNYAIGGASVFHYSGRVGASVSGGGDPTVPAAQGFMTPYGLSGGSTPCVEGDANFDPFGFCARGRAAVAARLSNDRFDDVVFLWSNGESDAGTSADDYAKGLTSVANYALASGCSRAFIGLTSKHASGSVANFDILETGVSQALTRIQQTGGNAQWGANLYRVFGLEVPLFPETDGTSYVHLTLRGQLRHALAWNAVLSNAGV